MTIPRTRRLKRIALLQERLLSFYDTGFFKGGSSAWTLEFTRTELNLYKSAIHELARLAKRAGGGG